jgi:electron transport complex protein RnfB
VTVPAPPSLADRIDAALPQTQCTRCGEPDCRRYAEAIAEGRAPINRCPPGGAEGIQRLAALTQQPVLPLDKLKECLAKIEAGIAKKQQTAAS